MMSTARLVQSRPRGTRWRLRGVPTPLDRAKLLALGTAFEVAFEQHATEEDQLLNELPPMDLIDPGGA